MTERHIKEFSEDNMHLYIPEFTANGEDKEKIWLTFCYAISQAGGPNVRYEVYSKDIAKVLGGNWSAMELSAILNTKYGDYIKHTTVDAKITYFWWVNQNFEWVEEIFTAGIAQRTWVHLFNQFWCRTGFNPDIFDRTSEPNCCWSTSWAEVGHGTFKHDVTVKKVAHLLKGQHWMPKYLLPKLAGNHLTEGGRYPKYL